MLKGKSIRTQMIATFIPLTLLTTLLIVFLSYWTFSSRMGNMLTDSVYKTVDQVNRHVDTYLDEFNRLSVLPYYYPELLSVMESTGRIGQTQYDAVQKVISGAISNPREDLQGVFIYRNDGQIFSATVYTADIDYKYPFKRSRWYLKAVAQDGKAVFMGADDRRILNRPNPAFSVVRSIKLYNGPILGTIVIDANYNGLRQLFEKVDLGGESSNFIVLGDDGKVIYSKDDRYLGAIDQLSDTGSDPKSYRIGGEEVIVSSRTSEVTGWKVIGIVSKTELFHAVQLARNLLVMISILLTVLFTIASIVFASSITSPLRRLKKLMQEVAQGNYSVAFQTTGMNEISEVGRAFNKMSREIDDLVNQVLKVRYQQKEAELHYLKLQIRPHFLFNNLESIRALAELEEKKGILDITKALGAMLRYSINKQNRLVRLSEELNQIRNYLMIEQIRSGHSLQIEFDVAEDAKDGLVMPIILQPIVENCVQHGFRSKMSDKRIRISGRVERERLVLEVRDNGSGMDAAALERLERLLAEPVSGETASPGSGIGLQNVHARLVLMYGPEYGLRLSGEPEKGTAVRLLMPHMTQMPPEPLPLPDERRTS